MANWLRFKPMLVLTLALLAPVAALAHVFFTWGPQSLYVRRLATTLRNDAAHLVAYASELEAARAENAALQNALAQSGGPPWLAERQHFAVFNAISRTLESNGARVGELAFDEPRVYAFTPKGDMLACEEIKATCHGSYAALTRALDELRGLALPMRIKELHWARGETELMLSFSVQVPFAPDERLAQTLRETVGLEEVDPSEP